VFAAIIVAIAAIIVAVWLPAREIGRPDAPNEATRGRIDARR